ncbi:hypothetical protein D3C76_1839640 [compost metagenome]
MDVFASILLRGESHRATQGVRHLVQAAILATKLHEPARKGDVVQDLRLLEAALLIQCAQFADRHDILL